MAEEQKPAAKERKSGGRLPSAKKRDFQSLKRQVINNRFKASVRTAINAFEAAVIKGDKAGIQERLNTVFSLMDKGVKTNKFKLNKAARTKSRLVHRLKKA